jgi:Ca-activated chloride channel homolog
VVSGADVDLVIAGNIFAGQKKAKTMKVAWIVLMLVVFSSLNAQAPDIRKGNAYFKNGQYGMAEQHYASVLKSDPENETARYNLGLALYQQQKFREAEAVWQKLATGSPNYQTRSFSYYNKGVIQSHEQRLEESIDSYKDALRINPDDKEARENLQKALSELKKNQGGGGGGGKDSGGGMDKDKADKQLEKLQDKESKLQQNMQKKEQSGAPQSKDW